MRSPAQSAWPGQPPSCSPNLPLYGLGFVLFRLADIVKPWPALWADRTIKGGFGVMLDDVLVAVYAGGALLALATMMET